MIFGKFTEHIYAPQRMDQVEFEMPLFHIVGRYEKGQTESQLYCDYSAENSTMKCSCKLSNTPYACVLIKHALCSSIRSIS